jgi:chemotaxis signal transduction protein
MSGGMAGVNERADALRRAFDQSFATAPGTETDTAGVENLLAIRVGSHPYVLRLAEVSGLFADKKITWLPSPLPELRGIAGLRGMVLPVYDLGMLLGSARAAAPRWLLVTATTPVGLAFDGFDGYLSVRPETIVPEVRAEARERHVREVVRTVDVVRPLVSLTSVLESIKSRASHDG